MWRKDAFGWGFSFALGAAILLVLLLMGWRLLEAVLGIATPFFVGIVIALLLNPIVNHIQRQWVGGRRLPAVVIVFVGFLGVFVALLAFVIPNLITQTQSLVRWFTPITYTVKRKTADGGSYATVISSLATTDYTVKNLINGAPYTFAVYAVDDNGTTTMVGSPVRVTPVKTDNDDAGAEALTTTTTTTAPVPEQPEQPAPLESPEPSPTASAGAATPTPSPTPSPSPSPEIEGEQSQRVEPMTETRTPVRERRRPDSKLPRPRPSIGPVEEEENPVPILPGPGRLERATPTPSPEATVSALDFFGGYSYRSDGRAYAQELSPTPTVSPSASPSVPSQEPIPSPTASASAPRSTPLVTQKTTTTVVRPGSKGKSPSRAKTTSVVGTTLSATPGDGSVRLKWKPPTTNVSGIDSVRAQVDKWLSGHRKIGPIELPSNFEAITTQYGDQVTQGMKTYASHIGEIIVSSASRLLTIVLVPIIIFYVLSDIDRLRGRLLFLLPEASRASVSRGAEDVGNVFGSYVRGMLIVSSIYGVTAMIVFAYWLKSYSLLLGVAAGILYIVPFIGPMVTALLAGVLSIISGLSPTATLGMLGLCLAQNQIFDNFVVPRVVGHSVGLHPLLTLFALFLGGEMFGLWGMLLSVPIAASIQVTLFRLFPKFAAPTPLAMLLGKDRPSRKSEDSPPPLATE
ncbi:MAG: AI-2E family transporter, partial [Armatimonadota bacterium]